MLRNNTVAIVGLGYVGLPLAVALSKHFSVVGFDINEKRVAQLRNAEDASGEISVEELKASSMIFTDDPAALKDASFIIVCVPTPIDKHNKPDLFCLESSSELVGKNMSAGSIIVYESTVYPGLTEEGCVPILEKYSGLKCGVDFKVGYSPERINPGDKDHSIHTVTKIVSGMDAESLRMVDYVYGKVTKTHKASSIKVAEAAKVIENIQRDLNIALMNELAIICDKMGINVYEVLEAAGTKWNFHKYHPGLVGGHCIGVDPYYLTHKAQGLGYHPDVILAGRRINDEMHKFYAHKTLKRLQQMKGNKVLVLGLTFKPNVSDYRNSRVKHFIKELQEYHVKVSAYDPYLSKEIIEKEFGCAYAPVEDVEKFDLAVLMVAHERLNDVLWKEKVVPLQKL